MNGSCSGRPVRQDKGPEQEPGTEKPKGKTNMSVELTIGINRTSKAESAEQRDRNETYTDRVDVWNDCAYRLVNILDGLGAEHDPDDSTGDSIRVVELTCEQFRQAVYDSILEDYVNPPQWDGTAIVTVAIIV